MAGNLGATITMAGAEDFKKSLRTISQQLRETGSELRAISSDFDVSDKSEQNVINTTNKYSRVLSEQKALYNTLENKYSQMARVYEENRIKLDSLNAEKDEETDKLSKIEKELGKSSKEYEKQAKVVAELEKEIDKTDKEQNNNVATMSRYKTQMNNTKVSINETSDKIKKFGENIEESDEKAKKASNGGYTVLKNIVANVLTSAFQKLTSLISGQFSSAIERVDNIRAFGITLQNLGYSENEVTETTDKLVKGIQGLPTSLPEIMSVQKQFVALNGSLGDATDLTLALNNATIAGGQGQSVANSALTQWYQIIANGKPDMQSWRIINQAMPAQLNQIAESIMGVGNKSSDLYDAWQKGTVTTEQVTSAIVKLNNEGSGSMESFAKQAVGASGGIQTSFNNLKLAITNGLANMIEIIGGSNISSALDGFKNATKSAFEILGNALKFIISNGKTITTILIAIGAALVPILVVTKITDAVSKATVAIKSVTATIENAKKAFSAFSAVLAANPIMLVVAAVSALIVIFISLWNNCEEFRNFFINLWQNIQNAVSSAVRAIGGFFANMWSGIQAIFGGFVAFFSGLWQGVVGVFSGVAQWFGDVFSGAWNGITSAFSAVGNFFKDIWDKITSPFRAVADWFRDKFNSAKEGVTSPFNAVGNFFKGIWDKITFPFRAVADWFRDKFNSAKEGLTSPFNAVGDFFKGVWDKITAPFRAVFDWFRDIGGNIVKGIWEGITGSLDWIKNKITGWVGNVLDFFKKLFGINSPSKLFRDEIGVGLAEGIGVGFEKEMKNVYTQIDEATPKSFDVDSNVNFNRDNYGPNSYQGISYFDTVSAFKEALSGMTVEMDNENMGNFVRKTVTKAIYA